MHDGQDMFTFSDWTALTVKEWILLMGKALKEEPERPLGAIRLLAEDDDDDAKLLLSWLAMGDAVAAAIFLLQFLSWKLKKRRFFSREKVCRYLTEKGVS